MQETQERIYERAKTLQKQNAVSQEDLEKASLDLEMAKIKLAKAEIHLLKAKASENGQ
jgi:hypothetical protein